jgi:hypothetical protein
LLPHARQLVSLANALIGSVRPLGDFLYHGGLGVGVVLHDVMTRAYIDRKGMSSGQ